MDTRRRIEGGERLWRLLPTIKHQHLRRLQLQCGMTNAYGVVDGHATYLQQCTNTTRIS